MNDEINTIFETEYWKVILMTDQAYLGRSVVVLKRQCADLADIDQKELLDFFAIVKKLEHACRNAFNATMFNWCCLMNNAYQNTPADPQVHWHFRPRYEYPITVGELKFVDPEFAHHYDSSRKMEVTPKMRIEIIQRIHAGMDN